MRSERRRSTSWVYAIICVSTHACMRTCARARACVCARARARACACACQMTYHDDISLQAVVCLHVNIDSTRGEEQPPNRPHPHAGRIVSINNSRDRGVAKQARVPAVKSSSLSPGPTCRSIRFCTALVVASPSASQHSMECTRVRIHTHTLCKREREKERERKRKTETETHTDRQTDR